MDISRIPASVMENVKKCSYKKGERIIEAGEANSTFYMVRSGVCAAMKTSPEGQYAYIGKYGAGQYFGELEIIDSGKVTTEVVALEDCELWCLQKEPLLRWMREDFDFTMLLMRDLSLALRRHTENSLRQQFCSVRQRVAQVILSYDDAGLLSTLDKNTLSLLAKTPIRSVNRALMELRNMGAISTANKAIGILDVTALTGAAMVQRGQFI